MRSRRPGMIPDNRIGIFGPNGECHGTVGHRATAATVRRFGVANAELKKVRGRYEWHGQSAPIRRRRVENANQRSARGSNPPPR